MSGKYLIQKSGYRAYIPNPLPPPLIWEPGLLRMLAEAGHALGVMSGQVQRISNVGLMLRPFIGREAVFSSRIEGTRTTYREFMGASGPKDEADLREVSNYVDALNYGLKRLKTLPMSLRLVRELHERLMRGARGEHAAPGEFRRTQNWIGRAGSTLATASYVPPPPDLLMECLGSWEKAIYDETLPPLVQAALLHYQFEAIHPFLDGNGRVGRLMIILFLMERKVLPAPCLYLSAHFEKRRDEYYGHLKNIREKNSWEDWLFYFLEGVQVQSTDVSRRLDKMEKLIMAWRLKSKSHQTSLLLTELVESPYITVKEAAKHLGCAFSTAQRAVDRLVAVGALDAAAKGAKRNRVYKADSLLRLFDEEDK